MKLSQVQSIMFHNIVILLVQLILPVVQIHVISYTLHFYASHEFQKIKVQWAPEAEFV